MRKKLGSLLLLTLLAFPGRLSAQSNAALAESLYQEGKRLMGEKKYSDACPKFAESQKLDAATGTLLNLAACYEEWGKYATAWAHFSDALVAAKRESQDFRVKYAQDHLSALEEKLTRLQVDVAPEAKLPGLEVKLDGSVLSSASFGVPSPVDPGTHVIEAAAPGKKSRRIELQANAPKSVVKALVPAFEDDPSATAKSSEHASDSSPPPGSSVAAPAAAASSSTPASPPEADQGGSGGAMRAVGFTIGGLGVVGVVAGTVFHFMAASENDKALRLCRGGAQGNECSSDAEATDHHTHVDAAKANQLISFVGWGVGGAALVTGIVLVAGSGSGH
ncbi:MAG TPA: hypothetical protein VGP93_16735, partial [Polyangiaceae bacterium]|nr:hypothetical protein [Polyangiaceae bacterium]